jgi:hypothetical protein
VGAHEFGFVSVPPPPSLFVQPTFISADTTFSDFFVASNLINQLSSADAVVAAPANSRDFAYAGASGSGVATLTFDFAAPQDLTDFVFWNFRNGEGNLSRLNGTASIELRLFDGSGGTGNLLATLITDVDLADENGDIASQIFDLGAIVQGVSSGVLVLRDNDGTGFVGAHEIGFLTAQVPEPTGVAMALGAVISLVALGRFQKGKLR